MIANESSSRPRSAFGPSLACASLPPFKAAEIGSVRAAFQSAAHCELRQTWEPAASPRFAAAVVRVGGSGDTLRVFAELSDADIITRASGLNQRLWELGDAFEIFLQPEGQEAYVEFQVAPNNQRLQLRFANRAALDRARREGSLDDVLIPGDAFQSNVWIEPGRWCVLADIPGAVVSGAGGSLAKQRWRSSFSRYDYTRGHEEPVISSTSPHPVADFHRQEEWGELRFVE